MLSSIREATIDCRRATQQAKQMAWWSRGRRCLVMAWSGQLGLALAAIHRRIRKWMA